MSLDLQLSILLTIAICAGSLAMSKKDWPPFFFWIIISALATTSFVTLLLKAVAP